MLREERVITLSALNDLDKETVGYDVLRYISLPNLLGSESQTLLYYMGKNLARSFEINSIDDVYFVFEKLGWGFLELVKERKNQITFSLMSDPIARRLKSNLAKEFRLEAGFLSETVHMVYERDCECVEKINKNLHQVQFKVVFID